MHNNYHFLEQLTKALAHKLEGHCLLECFSQNKNELILIFSNDFIIKAHLSSRFCCLSFPENFHRARKNSVDLFTEIVNERVTRVEQHLNERAFSLHFDTSHILTFKMHGNRSNIILFQGNTAIKIFNNNLIKDLNLRFDELDRPIDQSLEKFKSANGNLRELYPTFGKEVSEYLMDDEYNASTLEAQWSKIQELLYQMSEGRYFVTDAQLSLIKIPDSEVFKNPIEAINVFFLRYIATFQLQVERKPILNRLNQQLKKGNSYLKKTRAKLEQLRTNQDYRKLGDLIMANLHAIEKGSKEVRLPDFYQEGSLVLVPLKPTLSPQKNAETYYRKAKNQKKEFEVLETNIQSKANELVVVEEHIEALTEINELKTLRNYLKDNNLLFKKQDEVSYKPYHLVNYMGFDIWVGKNASANDQMLQLAYKEDLWLHAKDVSGSHVLIKYQAGKTVGNDVKEKAAELAAFYSKRKNDSLCPVIITPKKFVRKRKGDPPGAVVVDKESVLLVKPSSGS